MVTGGRAMHWAQSLPRVVLMYLTVHTCAQGESITLGRFSRIDMGALIRIVRRGIGCRGTVELIANVREAL